MKRARRYLLGVGLSLTRGAWAEEPAPPEVVVEPAAASTQVEPAVAPTQAAVELAGASTQAAVAQDVAAPTEVAAGPAAAPTEVVVRGSSSAERLRRSAQAVEVVELERAQRTSSDLGEVLARSSSLRVQRQGGLGSQGRYSLNGLGGDRVRFFLDGLPLELTAFQLGVGNVPLGLVERVEVYQGVVPVRFGADALGGAVNLVSDESVKDSRFGASYELASFGTHRLSATGRVVSEDRRAFARAAAFLDTSANDYPVDVDAFDDSGEQHRVRVRRFHDGYRGTGAVLAAGLLGRKFADRLVLQGQFGDYQRDLQHNGNMTVPYGEVTYGRRIAGVSLSYRKRLASTLRLDAVLDYTARATRLRDLSHCRYDWYGRCFVALPLGGEMDSIARDSRIGERIAYGRLELLYLPAPAHQLRFALTPSVATRRGRDEQVADASRDPLQSERRLTTGVLGAEYEAQHGRLASLTFAKAYLQRAKSDLRALTAQPKDTSASHWLFGAGDSLRWRVQGDIYLKGSFEYAARLPTGDERFGDGGLIAESPALEPERSENVNLGVNLEPSASRVGSFRGSLTGSGRRVESMIVLLNTGSYYQYQNVLDARALGVDARAGWTAPADRGGVEASFGYQDVRSASTTGPGALFDGDRIPNMPYLQASLNAYVAARDVLGDADLLELDYGVRYVRRFLLGWESAAKSADRLEVPSQTVHTASVSYVMRAARGALTNSFEVQNLTDARVFDFYGVQRPGRSFHWKASLEFP